MTPETRSRRIGALTPLPDGGSWPRSNLQGLADGWPGYAWVRLHLALRGSALHASTVNALRRRLEQAEARPDLERGVGPWTGFGGAVLAAALLARLDSDVRPLRRRLQRLWASEPITVPWQDVCGGHPGVLLAAAEMQDMGELDGVSARFLRRAYDITMERLADRVAQDPKIWLGFAHGLSGLLLAAEVGRHRLGLRARRSAVPEAIDCLARHARRAGGAYLWPADAAAGDFSLVSTWCNGVPGIALAMHGCWVLTQKSEYRELYEGALHACRTLASGADHFCCGNVGRAHVFVELFRRSGNRRLLVDARASLPRRPSRLRERCKGGRGFSWGRLGVDYLMARIDDPADLPIPLTGLYRLAPSV